MAAPSVTRKRAPPPPPDGEGGNAHATRAGVFLLHAEHGGGVARRSRVTEGAAAEIDACALRDAADVFADRGFGIGIEARDGEEAVVHVERRARAWTAIVGGWVG